MKQLQSCWVEHPFGVNPSVPYEFCFMTSNANEHAGKKEKSFKKLTDRSKRVFQKKITFDKIILLKFQ